MKLKLIFLLSLLGLIMGVATVELIPDHYEFIFWIVIALFSACIIAKYCTGKYFLHGFLLSMLSAVWVTAAHVIHYSTYVIYHTDMANLGSTMHILPTHPRLLMVLLCPVHGAVFGLIQGLLAYLASKIIKKDVVVSK